MAILEELDEFEDELDDEYFDSFDNYDPDRFDRRRINRALHKLADAVKRVASTLLKTVSIRFETPTLKRGSSSFRIRP
jgi:hypothetical protein